MSLAVVVQTCDLYEKYWGGFLHFMERHWDFDIDAQIYLCNEVADVSLPCWCKQVKTGRGTFVENLNRSIDSVGEEHIFLMLEDFWPIAPMRKSMFEALYNEFVAQGMDALQISNYTPYYTLKPTEKKIEGNRLLEFDRDSKWVFNLQARFWRSEVLKGCLVEPSVSEREVGSAITAEMASDELVREKGGLKAALFHYLWYPLSGVSYRGDITEHGKHLRNVLEIDRHVESLFS